jgi:hypothetical protein
MVNALHRSWDSAVGIATGQPTGKSSSPGGGEDFLVIVHTGSYPMRASGSFPGAKTTMLCTSLVLSEPVPRNATLVKRSLRCTRKVPSELGRGVTAWVPASKIFRNFCKMRLWGMQKVGTFRSWVWRKSEGARKHYVRNFCKMRLWGMQKVGNFRIWVRGRRAAVPASIMSVTFVRRACEFCRRYLQKLCACNCKVCCHGAYTKQYMLI